MSSIDWSAVPRARAIRQIGGRVPWFNGGWPVRALAIEPRGRFFVSQGERGLRLFHAATGELVRTLSPRVAGVSPERVGFSADGATVFARIGGFHERKSICVWDVESGAVLREIAGPAEMKFSLGAPTEKPYGNDLFSSARATRRRRPPSRFRRTDRCSCRDRTTARCGCGGCRETLNAGSLAAIRDILTDT